MEEEDEENVEERTRSIFSAICELMSGRTNSRTTARANVQTGKACTNQAQRDVKNLIFFFVNKSSRRAAWKRRRGMWRKR